jgi:hypothetical protein
MNRELGANEATRFPWVRNARIMSHQSGPLAALMPADGFELVLRLSESTDAAPPGVVGCGGAVVGVICSLV